MKILIGTRHPADVHVFKNVINELMNNGHDVFVVAREKEITYYLLNKLNIRYHRISHHQKTIIKKVFDYFISWGRIYRLCKKLKPDIAIGIGDFYLPQIGKLLGFHSIVITDTENVTHDPVLTFPFASHVVTPNCFKKRIGRKHILINCYKELAYLDKKYFTPDETIVEQLKLRKNERYLIMRLVSRTAVHDIGHKGLSMKVIKKAVKSFSKYARVFISSEEELPETLKKYEISIPPEKMHDALFYSDLLYGESATMASEAACLGTPAIFVDDVGRGYTDEQEAKYGLVFNFTESIEDQERSIEKGLEILNTPGIKEEWLKRRKKMLADKIDVTAFMVWFVENYPESVEVMKEDSGYQYNFRSADYADYTD